ERIRDKIAASKQKGMWMGGMPPLGYECRDHKLIVIPAEAETVRHIFRRYAALGSVRLLQQELANARIGSKSWLSSSGRSWGGKGQRMTPSHAVKKGMRYRYYVSQSLIGKSRKASPEGLRIAAAEIEGLVLSGIGELIADRGRLADTLSACIETAGEQQRMLQRAAGIAMTWADLPE